MVSLSFTAESKTQRTSGIDSHAAEGSKGDADCTLAWREQLPKGSQIKRGLQVYPLHYPCHCYYVPRVLQQFVSASTTATATTTTLVLLPLLYLSGLRHTTKGSCYLLPDRPRTVVAA